jgi:hypothetical protein
MISTYLTDTVDIVTRIVDQWGAVTETTQAGVRARWEDKNSIVRDQTGKEVVSNVHLLLDPAALVSYQSMFMLKMRCGKTAELPAKKWPVKSFTKGHGFAILDWEVWL